MTRKHIKLGKISVPDVRSKKDVPALEKLLKKGPITFVLVYADWCGHCNKYKNNVWSPLKSMKNRTSNLASVHYDQLENTSLANAKIDGYPSMLVVGNDKKPATFNTNSGVTNAMPNSNDLETMKKVVSIPVNTSVSSLNSTNTNTATNVGNVTNLNRISTIPDVRTPMSQNVRLSPLLSPSDVPMSEDELPVMNVDSIENSINVNVPSASASANVNVPSANVNVPSANVNVNVPSASANVNVNVPSANANANANVNLPSASANANVPSVNANANVPTSSLPPNIESDIVENSRNRAINLNKSQRKTQTRGQGSTPLLEGGRLYKSLSYKKRKSSRATKKRRNKRKN